MVIVAQLCKYMKNYWLVYFSEWALWYVNYLSLKLLHRTQQYEAWLTQLLEQGSEFPEACLQPRVELPGGTMEASPLPVVTAMEMPAHLPHRSRFSKLVGKKQKQKQTQTKNQDKKKNPSLQKKMSFSISS